MLWEHDGVDFIAFFLLFLNKIIIDHTSHSCTLRPALSDHSDWFESTPNDETVRFSYGEDFSRLTSGTIKISETKNPRNDKILPLSPRRWRIRTGRRWRSWWRTWAGRRCKLPDSGILSGPRFSIPRLWFRISKTKICRMSFRHST